VFNVNTEEYPKIKAELLVLDEFDQQIQITSTDDLRVTEEGISREVTAVACPTPTANKKISVILVFDISTSMQGERLAQAKTASKSLVNLVLEREGSEVSVIAFADQAFVASDFNEDISNLDATIDALEANGSTNYENPFLDPISGAINLAEKAKNEVHILFMTDGYGKLDPEKVIINSSKAGLIVHTVAFNIAIPEVLKLVSDNTGGLSFNNLQSETELVEAFEDILDFAQESNRCTIEWQTQGCLTDRGVIIDYLPKSLRDEFRYFTDAENFAFFAYPNDRFAIFEQPSIIQIPVSSQNGSIRIDSIVSNNKAFKVLSPSISSPILVEPDQQIQVSLEFDPEDDKLSTAVITIHSSSCRFNQIFAIGGNDGKIPNGDGLELVTPLGGEVYNKNTDTVIEWKGVLPTQEVKLEFSSDSGINWQPITDEADSLVFRHRYPDIVSDLCKVRVSQESSTIGQKIYGKPDTLYDVIDLSWDRSGFRIALAHTDGKLEIISSVNGNTQMLFELPLGLTAVDYSFDDIRISTADSQNVYISNMISGQTDTVIKFDDSFRITDIKFHPNGKLMAVAGRDSLLEIYDIRTWEKQESIFLDAGEITSVEWSPDGSKISATTNNIKVYIIDTLDYANPTSFDATDNTRRLVTASSWSPDGKLIAVSTNLRRSKIFDTSTLAEVNDYQHHTVSLLNDIAWHPELNSIVTIAEDSRSIVFDPDESDDDLAVIYDFSNSYYFNQVEWSPSGNRFAVALSNQLGGESVIVYSFDDFVLQSDESKVFSLVDQDIDQKDIFVGTTVIGKPLDNNEIGFIVNTSNFDVVIDSLSVEGEEFDISGNVFPKTIATGDSIGLFSQFTPNRAGLTSSVLTSHTSIGEYQSQIAGEGSNSDLSALIGEIDFGEVLVNTSVDTVVAVVFNTSLQAINYSDQTLLPIPNTPYQLNSSTQGQIDPLDSMRLDITFAPTTEGIKQNVVTINNESELDPFQVKVTGLGVAPLIMLPDTVQYQRGVCSEKVVDSIIVKNTGSGNLLISDIDYLGTGVLLITNKNHIIGAGDSTFIVYEAQLENSSLTGTLSFVSNASNSQDNMSIVFRLSTSRPEFQVSGGVDFPLLQF
jgi:WD40 repeat protein